MGPRGDRTSADKTSYRWQFFVVVGVIWIATAGMSVWLLGVWPKSTIGWLCILALGPIAFFLLSALGELIGQGISAVPGIRHADRAVERRTAGESISGIRVTYYLVRSLVLVGAVLVVFWWVRDKLTAVAPFVLRDWWLQHFR